MTTQAGHMRQIASAASIVSLATLVSRLLGFVRDMAIAWLFGAGMMADAFFAAFRIPSTLRELLGEGALSAAFVPMFTRTATREGRQAAWDLASAVMGTLVVVLAGTLPWTLAALREWWRAARGAGRRSVPDALLASWVGLPIVFFSSSGSKLPAYVLPLFPALAVLASRWPKLERRGHWLRIALVTFAVFLALLAAATPFSSQLGSPRALARSLKDVRRPGEHVVEYGVFNAGLPFYLGETVPMLEVGRDIGFEGAGVHERALITRGDLARMVNTQGRAWVVGKEPDVQALAKALGFKAARVAGSGEQTLLSLDQPG